METKKRIRLILAALLSLSGVLPAVATDYQASDYLPLAVGNSWTYKHKYSDLISRSDWRDSFPAYFDQRPALDEPFRLPEFTISVLNTEVIDGKTYYVISDMPANWPPAPQHFIAGKKLRWEGTHLMERIAYGEQAIYRFDGDNEAGYTIPTDEVVDVFKVEVRSTPVPRYLFSFISFNWEWSRGWGWGVDFLAGYGIGSGLFNVTGGDERIFNNRIDAIRAVLGGVTVEYKDAPNPTSSSSSSWGQVKQSWLAGERRGQ